MILMQEILDIMPTAIQTAMTSAQLFERCKGAETVEQVAKVLSAGFTAGKFDRTKTTDSKYIYWLKGSFFSDNNCTSITSPLMDALHEVEIPQFLDKNIYYTDDLTVADSIDEKLGADQPKRAFKTAVNEINIDLYETIKQPSLAPFKVAITSAKTLVLEGISEKPIELTQQQARILCDFLGQFDAQAYFL